LETRYLKSLIAVVDSGSIADAARAEHLTAAAVGQRVQAPVSRPQACST